MQQLEKYGARLRDGLNNLIAMIQERPECLQDLYAGGEQELRSRYQELLQEIPTLDLQRDLVELPPCTIQTMQQSLYKPFLFQG